MKIGEKRQRLVEEVSQTGRLWQRNEMKETKTEKGPQCCRKESQHKEEKRKKAER